ncbi:ABC transporter permease [Clostridium sp. YIM B02555]|uniref:ABC transporter permease n=1 Tax=Clostridium sp. YIM B02555 TaxID=2911968 RepID=UPI001EEDA591|nr:ABC transporter permease [Clostridium sp. YIM B02555]
MLKEIYLLVKDLIKSRNLIFELAKNDFKGRYAGSFLGVMWGFINPLITMAIYWFVFQVGFRTPEMEKVPYILWMIAGTIPWYFFSDAVNFSSTCLIEYSYLVKKVVFRVDILPLAKIISALFIHIFLVVFIFVMFFLYGYHFDIHYIQIVYYIIATIYLCIGISWITSALVVFLKDFSQVIQILLQFGFWLTPIFWSYKMIPDNLLVFFKLNPMYYIISGFRDTFIEHVWFWERYNQTAYFWIVSSLIFLGGVLFFRRLKPHFADLL